MDSVFHRHGLANEAHEGFLPTLDSFTSGERWIVDGNYTSHVTRRTLRRTIMRQEPWPGVREPISNLYSLDPRRNIMARTWTRHAHVRQKYETARAGGSWGHATVLRLTTPTDVARFLDSLTGAQN